LTSVLIVLAYIVSPSMDGGGIDVGDALVVERKCPTLWAGGVFETV